MGFYSQVVLPRFYDLLMDSETSRGYRKQVLADAVGDVLEIGVGTGLNLPHYPSHVRRITTVDPNAGMNKMAQKRIEQTGIEVDRRVLGSEELPFDKGTFDCVVSTWTLCSIQQVEQAMSELYRVLKPGGRLLFFEHGLSDDPKVGKWQSRLNWLQRRVADGCRLDLNVRQLFAAQPFASLDIETFYMEKTPKTHGFMYRGVATK